MSALTFGAIAQGFVKRNSPGRRTEQPVRRESYDVGDRKAQVFRPIGDGTKKSAMRWRDQYLKVAKEYDWAMKKKGERHPLGGTAIRVLEALLFLPGLDFKTGRLDPAIATIQKLTRYARATVVRALAILKQHGFLSWVRRTERTGNAPGEGPAVRQVTNAYFFDPRALCGRAILRLTQLIRRGEAEPTGEEPARRSGASIPLDPGMAKALASLEAVLPKEASSELSPESRIRG